MHSLVQALAPNLSAPQPRAKAKRSAALPQERSRLSPRSRGRLGALCFWLTVVVLTRGKCLEEVALGLIRQ